MAAALALLAGIAATTLTWMLSFSLRPESHINVSIAPAPVRMSTQPDLPEPASSVFSPAAASTTAAAPASTTTAASAQVQPRHGEYALTFSLGPQTYAAIDRIIIPDSYDLESDELESLLPAHGVYFFFGDEHSVEGVAASLQRDALPADLAAWLGREVVVDGSCVTTVEELTLVGLISGSYDYFDDGSSKHPSTSDRARQVVRSGALYIAAKLGGCPSDRLNDRLSDRGVARLTSLSEPVSATLRDDRHLVERGKSKLFASEYAVAAQQAYVEAGHQGRFYRDPDADITSQVFSHPQTGQTWLSTHVMVDYGCGGANINLWALYRVTEAGELFEVRVLDSLDLSTLGHPIDLDGDGLFEFPSQSVYGDSSILAMDGTALRTLEVPFYGCPC